MSQQLVLMPTPDAVQMEQLVYHTYANHRLSFASVWGRPHSWRPRGWSEARARKAVEDALAAGSLATVECYDGTYLQSTRDNNNSPRTTP